MAATAFAAVVALVACDGSTGPEDPLTQRPGDGPSAGGPLVQRDASIPGEWTRRLVIMDNAGGISESGTTWRFASDGDGRRTLVSRNYTAGLIDSVTTDLQWSTSGDRLTIDFLPPASGRTSFRYRVVADTLSLDELRFVRQ